MGWRLLHKAVLELESHVDALNYRSQQKGSHEIIVYNSFGTIREFYVRGRVLTVKLRPFQSKSRLHHLRRMYHRFQSDELPNSSLLIENRSSVLKTTTDAEGYFDVALPIKDEFRQDLLWHDVEVKPLWDSAPASSTFKGRILVPSPNSQFGVISDIDDTIVYTGATNFFRMIRQTFFRHPSNRRIFEGMAPLYRALHHGVLGFNPIFYVSSGPWNLYDFIVELLNIHNFPMGPVMLSDFGFDEEKFLHRSHTVHKLEQIARVLRTYPELGFILFGDSGQEDVQIYHRVLIENPGRIKTIYIRDVTEATRDEQVRKVALEAASSAGELIYSANTADFAEHAAAKGYIPERPV